ncbi:MAG TPA: flavodoxin domain-containing protein [Acidimicrobiales bacterium]|nr:flavodoxin domain-containing protein [Acidimicrobiales bacterium]
MTVLVAYATCHGSTRGIAERIGGRLAHSGVDVDVRPMTGVADAGAYEGAVLGSAVHGGRWLPDAAAFGRDQQRALAGHPVWLSSVSTLGDDESMLRPRTARRLRAWRKESAELTELRRRLRVRDHRNFAGAVSRTDWPLTGRVVFRVLGGRYGDHRNWAAIDAWADRIAAERATNPGSPEPHGHRH